MLPFEGVSSSDPLLDTSHVAPPEVPASLRRSEMKAIFSSTLNGFYSNFFKTTDCQVEN